MRKEKPKTKCLYKVGDIVNTMAHSTPVLITGYVLDDNGDVDMYEIVSTAHLMYCTENVIDEKVSNND